VVPLVSGSPRSQETHRRASGGHGQRGLLPRCAASRFEVHKATLASVLVKVSPGIRLNEHIQHEDGEIVFHYACKLGLEGIASKRKDSTYRSGRSPDCLKMKNPGLLSVQKMQASISRECDLAHTSPPGSFLRPA
jgi:hypothetical protein